ncbi:MAG: hypothetical protein ACI9EF_000244 [Pseudohongiellaceae bacterium]
MRSWQGTAASLSRLRDHLEQQPETCALQYELAVPIAAKRDSVWQALSDETNAWWLPDYHTLGAGSVVTLDARAGGQLIEALPDGGSLLWYTVQLCLPGDALPLVGHLGPQWGGPATTMLELALSDSDDGGTVLTVRDALYGCVSESQATSLRDGWMELFSKGLKAHVKS